jgi:CDP-glycerol glycerophosphotransferase (TagB/SpsB family)
VFKIPKINIKNLLIKDDKLFISATAKFKSEYDYKPRTEIIFSNKTENRRLPFINNSFNRDKLSNNCSASFSWRYELNNVFWNKELLEDIQVKFSLLYGEDFIENFKIVPNCELLHEESYYIPKIIDNELILKAKKKKLKKRNENMKKYAKLFTVNSFFLFLVGILEFPFFFIEGFLAYKGLAIKSPDFFRGNNTLKSILFHINWRTYKLSGYMYSKRLLKISLMKLFYIFLKHRKIKNNKISFLSERRKDLSGNFEFIYDEIKTNEDLSIHHFLKNKKIKELNLIEMIKYVNLISTSKIILLDDFYPNIHNFKLKKEVNVIQLWHAVGAFKTFGFSRLGKVGGTIQKSPNHRNYNYAIVSSEEIKRFYGEGFGISDEKVLSTGIPRTDIFFNEEYRKKIRKQLYTEYPLLKEKKVILFAPTFRGDGKEDAFYPTERFDIEKLFDSVENDQDYLLIIKHHPFVKEKTKIPKKYKDMVLDLSEESEINNLLFITDLLITDYSSVIFEASILDIPMIFYSYDLEEYIKNRDFYYDYNAFVPGKIVFKIEKISEAINNNDYDRFKVSKFKNKFFNDFDGKSSKRVVNLLYKIIFKR